jgi:hypothetical protein
MNAIQMIDDALDGAKSRGFTPQVIVAPTAIKKTYCRQIQGMARNPDTTDSVYTDWAHAGIRMVFSQRTKCVEVF